MKPAPVRYILTQSIGVYMVGIFTLKTVIILHNITLDKVKMEYSIKVLEQALRFAKRAHYNSKQIMKNCSSKIHLTSYQEAFDKENEQIKDLKFALLILNLVKNLNKIES